MDIKKQTLWLLLPLLLGVKHAKASIGHGPPGLYPVPGPLVVGWGKYVPQAVPPHVWSTSYLNTGVRLVPAPPYDAPTYPYPHPVPVPYPTQPLLPAVPVPSFNSAPPLVPTPTFNPGPTLLPAPTFNPAPPVVATPTFNPGPTLLPAPAFNPASFTPTPSFNARPITPAAPPPPVLTPRYPVPFPAGEPGANADPGVPAQTGSFVAPSGFLSPYVSPGVRGPSRPLPIRAPRPPPYSVTELEPEDTYGPPPSPYASKYRTSPAATYGPPREELYREYTSHPPVPHVVRVVARPSRYRSSEFLR